MKQSRPNRSGNWSRLRVRIGWASVHVLLTRIITMPQEKKTQHLVYATVQVGVSCRLSRPHQKKGLQALSHLEVKLTELKA